MLGREICSLYGRVGSLLALGLKAGGENRYLCKLAEDLFASVLARCPQPAEGWHWWYQTQE